MSTSQSADARSSDARSSGAPRIPATVISGFLGAGKTSLVRHVLARAGGRRIAVLVNEFGSLGIDGAALRSCGIPGCEDEAIVELANGCLCCTVADEFLPAMQALLDRALPPEHILIETSGLALPKPLLKAFDWPVIRARVTVDGVLTVVDAPAVAADRFADDPDEVRRQRELDPSLDHDNPLAEVFEDQLSAADLVILNKAEDSAIVDAARRFVAPRLRPGVPVVEATHGAVPLAALLGLGAAAEDDLASRPSHHDAVDGAHEHDDFQSLVATIAETADPDALVDRIAATVRRHDILRVKGFAAVRGKSMPLLIEAVGPRIRREYVSAATADARQRSGRLVVIGRTPLDEDAIRAALAAPA